MRLKECTELKRLVKSREVCGNGAQKEQGLRATHCQNEADISDSEFRENIRSPYVAFGRSATATEGDLMDLEAHDVGISKYSFYQDNTMS